MFTYLPKINNNYDDDVKVVTNSFYFPVYNAESEWNGQTERILKARLKLPTSSVTVLVRTPPTSKVTVILDDVGLYLFKICPFVFFYLQPLKKMSRNNN